MNNPYEVHCGAMAHLVVDRRFNCFGERINAKAQKNMHFSKLFKVAENMTADHAEVLANALNRRENRSMEGL